MSTSSSRTQGLDWHSSEECLEVLEELQTASARLRRYQEAEEERHCWLCENRAGAPSCCSHYALSLPLLMRLQRPTGVYLAHLPAFSSLVEPIEELEREV